MTDKLNRPELVPNFAQPLAEKLGLPFMPIVRKTHQTELQKNMSNKYIYALADYALVVSSSFGKGGTWAGAVEALSRLQDISVFVRLDGAVSEGNHQLHNQGAKPFPAEPWNDSLRELLVKAASEVEPVQTGQKIPQETVLDIHPQDIYQAVLPIILNYSNRKMQNFWRNLWISDYLKCKIG